MHRVVVISGPPLGADYSLLNVRLSVCLSVCLSRIGGAHQGLGGAKPPQIFHEICGCVLKKVSQQSLKR